MQRIHAYHRDRSEPFLVDADAVEYLALQPDPSRLESAGGLGEVNITHVGVTAEGVCFVIGTKPPTPRVIASEHGIVNAEHVAASAPRSGWSLPLAPLQTNPARRTHIAAAPWRVASMLTQSGILPPEWPKALRAVLELPPAMARRLANQS